MKQIQKTYKAYNVEGAKKVPSVEVRAKAVKLLTSLGFETFPGFGV